jgi:hypothetical protein
MRSFRARIERGRIIVHEPIDLPDGVISLVPVEPASVTRDDAMRPVVSTDAALASIEQSSDQRSSS